LDRIKKKITAISGRVESRRQTLGLPGKIMVGFERDPSFKRSLDYLASKRVNPRAIRLFKRVHDAGFYFPKNPPFKALKSHAKGLGLNTVYLEGFGRQLQTNRYHLKLARLIQRELRTAKRSRQPFGLKETVGLMYSPEAAQCFSDHVRAMNALNLTVDRVFSRNIKKKGVYVAVLGAGHAYKLEKSGRFNAMFVPPLDEGRVRFANWAYNSAYRTNTLRNKQRKARQQSLGIKARRE
jgi:hypothetical protein